MKLRTLFFCGERSPYGLCHLEPVLEAFNVSAIVVATKARWDLFREALCGKNYQSIAQETRLVGAYRNLVSWLFPMGGTKKSNEHYGQGQGIAKALRGRAIPVWPVFDVNDATFLEKVRRANPDLILSAAYPQIFSDDLIAIPTRGSINFHPSLLPKYRGAHPHFWAIMRGEKESGLTSHFMTGKIDEGDILAQVAFPIDQYNYHELYEKMITETPGLVNKVARYLLEGKLPVPQDSEKATTFRNDREIHRRIFWNIHTADEIRNLSRTLSAFCFFRSRRVMIYEAYGTKSNRNLTNEVRVEPGTIVDVYRDCLVIKTVDACINVPKLRDGNKPLTFDKWVKKRRVTIGEKFE